MKRYLIIANPVAGHGAGARAVPEIERLVRAQNLDFDLVLTRQAGHAIDLAREAALAGTDVVVSAGGDGTANEIINGLMQARREGKSNSALGVLGVGRGNDFAHAVSIPHELAAACRVLAEDQRRTIDIGRVVGGRYPEGRYFGSCVGVGFDAVVTIEVSKLPLWGGFLSFFIAILRTIFLYYKGPVVAIEFDGKRIEQPVLMVSVMNGRRLGGGFWMAPNSKPDDGLFDLCIARQVSRARIFGMLPHFMRGTQGTQKEITTGQGARISITAVEGVLPAQTDGEILCVDGRRLDIELLPRRLQVVCGKPGLSA